MGLRHIKTTLVVLLCVYLMQPLLARAVNTDTVGILPAYPDVNVRFSDAWFMYKVGLGEEKNDALKVINNEDRTVVVKLYPVDAVTTDDGSFALLPEDAERKDVGSWIKLSLNEVEIPPHSQKIVPFHVKVPANADVGDHQGGIIMQELETDGPVLSGTGVRIITRVGVRMYATIPGEIKKAFSITRFDWLLAPKGEKHFFKDLLDLNKKTVFLVGIKNEGNAKITPKIDVDIYNLFGQNIAHLPEREIGEVFPHEENSEGQIIWDSMPWAGRYKVKITVNTPEGAPPQAKEMIIWAIPYRLIFLLILVSVLVFLVRLIVSYFHEVAKEKMPIYQVSKGETLTSLSEKLMVSWKKVAKLNDLRPPYEMRAGKKLFIPLNKNNKALVAELTAKGSMFPSIAERRGDSGMGKKAAVAAMILILVASATVYGIRKRKDKRVHEQYEAPAQQTATEEKQETDEKTASGVYKKSSIKVVLTNNIGDAEAVRRLQQKLALIGYNIEAKAGELNKYSIMTIEYRPDKKEKVEMLKNDLGLQDQVVEMKENPALAEDAVIYPLCPPESIFNFPPPTQDPIVQPTENSEQPAEGAETPPAEGEQTQPAEGDPASPKVEGAQTQAPTNQEPSAPQTQVRLPAAATNQTEFTPLINQTVQ